MTRTKTKTTKYDNKMKLGLKSKGEDAREGGCLSTVRIYRWKQTRKHPAVAKEADNKRPSRKTEPIARQSKAFSHRIRKKGTQ